MNLRMLRKNLEGRREGGREKRRKQGNKTGTTDSVTYGVLWSVASSHMLPLCLRARVVDTPRSSPGFIVLQGSLVGGGSESL